MAQYLFLLRPADSNLGGLTNPEKEALFNKFVAWSASLQKRGQLVSVERLKMGDAGQTVRKKRDQIVVDGPYAEARECVSGFFILDAPDYAAATSLAAECPLVALGGA